MCIRIPDSVARHKPIIDQRDITERSHKRHVNINERVRPLVAGINDIGDTIRDSKLCKTVSHIIAVIAITITSGSSASGNMRANRRESTLWSTRRRREKIATIADTPDRFDGEIFRRLKDGILIEIPAFLKVIEGGSPPSDLVPSFGEPRKAAEPASFEYCCRWEAVHRPLRPKPSSLRPSGCNKP